MEDTQSTGGRQVAVYDPQCNKWSVLGNESRLHFKHFYPVIGTVHLFQQEYLYVMGDDYRFQHLELYDERAGSWIPIGVSMRSLKDDECIEHKHDILLNLSR